MWLGSTVPTFALPLIERRRELKGILPDRSRLVSEAISVVGRARVLFELMREHDPEAIVAQRLDDAYDPRIRWPKVKNPATRRKRGATCSTGRSGPG
jgi:ATP-dependent DNA ligase